MLLAQIGEELGRFWSVKLRHVWEFDLEDFFQFGDHRNSPERRSEVDHVFGTFRSVRMVLHLKGAAGYGFHDTGNHLLCSRDERGKHGYQRYDSEWCWNGVGMVVQLSVISLHYIFKGSASNASHKTNLL